MSSLTETSLMSMKAAFLAAPDPIQGIPKLASLIDLMLHMCCCLQTQKTPASDKMNMFSVLHHQVSIPSSQRKLTLQLSFRSHQKLTQSQIFPPAPLTTSARP